MGLRIDPQRDAIMGSLEKASEHLDDRIIHVLPYAKYLIVTDTTISIKEEFLDEVEQKIRNFDTLVETEELVVYDKDDTMYFDMLYEPGTSW